MVAEEFAKLLGGAQPSGSALSRFHATVRKTW
jgi:hypothetical protein